MTRQEFEQILSRCYSYLRQIVMELPVLRNKGIAPHVFELRHMRYDDGGMPLDQSTFREFLRRVVPFTTEEPGTQGDIPVFDEDAGGLVWLNKNEILPTQSIFDFINESILTILIWKDENGNVVSGMDDYPNDSYLGRIVYNKQTGRFYQWRENEQNKKELVALTADQIRNFQVVFIENQDSLEHTIYYTYQGSLISFIATSDHLGLMSKDDKAKLDGVESGAQRNIIEAILLNNREADIVNKKAILKVATLDENNKVDPIFLPVYVDEVTELLSVTTEPSNAKEGDKYYNATIQKIYTYVSGNWGTGEAPASSIIYYWVDGSGRTHQYRSDGKILIEIMEQLDLATYTTPGIVQIGNGIDVENGVISVDVDELDIPEYKVATITKEGLVLASSSGVVSNIESKVYEGREIRAGNVEVSKDGRMAVKVLRRYDTDTHFEVNTELGVNDLLDVAGETTITEKTLTNNINDFKNYIGYEKLTDVSIGGSETTLVARGTKWIFRYGESLLKTIAEGGQFVYNKSYRSDTGKLLNAPLAKITVNLQRNLPYTLTTKAYDVQDNEVEVVYPANYNDGEEGVPFNGLIRQGSNYYLNAVYVECAATAGAHHLLCYMTNNSDENIYFNLPMTDLEFDDLDLSSTTGYGKSAFEDNKLKVTIVSSEGNGKRLVALCRNGLIIKGGANKGGFIRINSDGSVVNTLLNGSVSTPMATTTEAGIIKIATDEDIELGIDTTKAVTPEQLKNATSGATVETIDNETIDNLFV